MVLRFIFKITYFSSSHPKIYKKRAIRIRAGRAVVRGVTSLIFFVLVRRRRDSEDETPEAAGRREKKNENDWKH